MTDAAPRPAGLGRLPRLVAAHSTRRGGVSPEPLGMNLSFRVGDDERNVRSNRERFLAPLGIREDQLAIPGQVHSATVRRVDGPGLLPECDALVTDAAGVFLSVSVADCLPLLLADPVTRSVAAVHAGWRGTASGIGPAAVGVLVREYGARPGDILAYLGPSARWCCYEVGTDVAERFAGEALRREGERTYLDLRIANERQLLSAGVLPENIESSPDCTITRADLYHSYRRDGARSGRMMAVIGLLPPAQ